MIHGLVRDLVGVGGRRKGVESRREERKGRERKKKRAKATHVRPRWPNLSRSFSTKVSRILCSRS